MAIDPDKLLQFPFPAVEQSYTRKDVILYALGIGHGADPLDKRDLGFVYEKNLRVAPTFPLVLGFTSLRNFDLGIQYAKVMHSAQQLTLHAPIPVQDTVVCETHISDVWDLGEARGAILRIQRTLTSRTTGTLLATTAMDAICRADGGFGGTPPPKRPAGRGDDAPDQVFAMETLPRQALLYRLSGDWNPLHADPAAAAGAGFAAPVMHGLGTLGIAVNGITRTLAEAPGAEVHTLGCRFTAPFFPGEALTVKTWKSADGIAFQALSKERGVVVLDSGHCSFRPAP